MATIYDIAREANTSASTVSRVLNGSARVGMDVKNRVKAAARRLHYEPRRVRRPRSRAILHVIVFLPHAPRPQAHLFYDAATLFTGIADGFGDIRHHLIVSPSDATDAITAKKLGDIDGCIFAFCTPSSDLRGHLTEKDLPTVLVNRTDRDLSYVCNDARAGIRKLLEEIRRRRPADRIAFVTVDDAGPVAESRRLSFAEMTRTDGGHSLRSFSTVTAIRTSDVESMYRGGVRVFMCVNDYVAFAVIDRLGRLGLRVPEDAGVTGYDNAPVLQLASRPVTTVDLSVGELGAQASRLLGARILDRSPGRESLLVASDLIAGESL